MKDVFSSPQICTYVAHWHRPKPLGPICSNCRAFNRTICAIVMACTRCTTATHGSFKNAVADVVCAAARAGEGEMLAVFVALLVGQLERHSQHVLGLVLPLILLLRAELTWIQTWNRSKLLLQFNYYSAQIKELKCAYRPTKDFNPHQLNLCSLGANQRSILHFY